jgi:methyl-accepting chemotaxis protein
MSRMKFGQKIYGIVGLIFIAMIAVSWIQVRQFTHDLEAQKRVELKDQIDIALGIVKAEYDAITTEGISVVEAQKRAAARLGVLRYGDGNYFWINDMRSKIVMHPVRPELNGRDVSDMKELNGQAIFVAFVDTVRRHGGGYVDYRWPKPGTDQPQQKFSYVAGFEPWQWVVGTGVYVDDMEKQIADAVRHTLIIAGLLMVVTAAIAVFVVRGMSHAIRTMTGAMNDLAAGRTDIALPAVKGSDEIGEMAKALTVFRQNLLRVVALRKENTEKDQQAAEQRQATLARLAHDLEGTVRKVADDLGSTALQIGTNAGVMEQLAHQTTEQANGVSSASTDAAGNVQIVATATAQLAASISEIGNQVTRAAGVASQAVEQGSRANHSVATLETAIGRIGEVIALINAIAAQTNLLALNATIEAAHAGEAGRGFAVVAQEVKILAGQTAKATNDIGAQICAVQEATRDVIGTIEGITATIAEISSISAEVASSVQEQQSATDEIASSVARAASGTQRISHNIGTVAIAANEAGDKAVELKRASEYLNQQSATLGMTIDQFLQDMRAA